MSGVMNAALRDTNSIAERGSGGSLHSTFDVFTDAVRTTDHLGSAVLRLPKDSVLAKIFMVSSVRATWAVYLSKKWDELVTSDSLNIGTIVQPALFERNTDAFLIPNSLGVQYLRRSVNEDRYLVLAPTANVARGSHRVELQYLQI